MVIWRVGRVCHWEDQPIFKSYLVTVLQVGVIILVVVHHDGVIIIKLMIIAILLIISILAHFFRACAPIVMLVEACWLLSRVHHIVRCPRLVDHSHQVVRTALLSWQ